MKFIRLLKIAALSFIIPILLIVFSGCNQNNLVDEEIIKKTINDSFGWALTKDRTLFESIFAKDENFFTFYPDSKSTVTGWNQFEKFLDHWMDPRNKATNYDIRDLRLVISQSSDVAWFSAIVDDNGEWDGKPWSSKDVRWTGILEKRNGKWVIVQQHMSEAKDKVIENIINETSQ
ncbi:MAG: nuclear transport factor 2 family protein [Candidatus Aminicenantes bacterium]|nr:nuclear transport factor 2 family protein [Candidatus Aminicenantes bacterium]